MEREGWLTIEPHRGAFVKGLDEASVRDHYELFGLVYGLIARRATERCTPPDLVLIAEAQKELGGVDDADAFFERNNRFLRLLFDAADTPHVASHLQVMSSLVPDNFFAVVPGSMENQKRGTAKVVRAMRGRDPDAAAAACLQWFRPMGDRVVALLSERGVLDDPAAAVAGPS